MKKILLVMCVFAGLVLTAQAQTADSSKMHRAHRNIYKELNLSAAQQQKLKALHQDMHSKASAIKNNNALSAADKKKQLKALHEQQKAETKTVLTPEQQAKAAQLKKSQGKKGKMKSRKITQKLNLTEAQKSQAKQLKQDAQTKRKSIQGNASLSAEQKKAALKQVSKDNKAAFAKILTPEQKSTLDSLHQQHAHKHLKNK